jgi:6-pyruvoyltetrahydropterin/6-carboxytetrahydropterin synthase
MIQYWAEGHFEAARQLNDSVWHGYGFMVQGQTELCHGVAPLQELLDRACGVLHGRLLNDVLQKPTDEALLHWFLEYREESQWSQLSITTGLERGMVWSASRQVLGWRGYRFEAAHQLPHVPAGHPCGRMHGHGFSVRVFGVYYSDWFAEIDRVWGELVRQLDRTCLNEIPGLEIPTSEYLSQWIWRMLVSKGISVTEVMVQETMSSGASYSGIDCSIWKELTADSALMEWPDGPLMGHTYRLRTVLTGAIQPLLGWTEDFAVIKQQVTPLLNQWDHHYLNDVVEKADLGSLVQWMGAQLRPLLPELSQLILWETPRRAVIWTPSLNEGDSTP